MPSRSHFYTSSDIKQYLSRLDGTDTEIRLAVADWKTGAFAACGFDGYAKDGIIPITLVCNLKRGQSDLHEIRKLLDHGHKVFTSEILEGAVCTISVVDVCFVFSPDFVNNTSAQGDMNVLFEDLTALREINSFIDIHQYDFGVELSLDSPFFF